MSSPKVAVGPQSQYFDAFGAQRAFTDDAPFTEMPDGDPDWPQGFADYDDGSAERDYVQGEVDAIRRRTS